MSSPAVITDVFLQPGEFHFGARDVRIRTLLGSCVSITLWHPVRHIGGMCHYMLPKRVGVPTGPLSGRYAEEAMELFMRELQARGTHPAEYQVKLFGGGHMFAHLADRQDDAVAARNIEAGRRLLEQRGFRVQAEDVGGAGHRQVIFELWNGHVWVKRTPLASAERDVA